MNEKNNVHYNSGDVLSIATTDVISIPPSKSIKDAAQVMMEHEFRRLPVTDPGSGKVLGIVTVMDILDFFGGGNKFNIIVKKYEDNFLAAINEPVREIMSRDVVCLNEKSSIKDVVNSMLTHQIGAIPLIDSDEKLTAIITERDIALACGDEINDKIVQDYMSTKVFITTPGTPIESACKIMVRNGLRRIPIVGGEADISKAAKKLLGIVTSTDIIRFLNAKELFSNLNSNMASKVLETKLSEIMVEDTVTAEPDDKISDLCELLKQNNIGGVPVIKDDVIAGIITERDILRAVKNL